MRVIKKTTDTNRLRTEKDIYEFCEYEKSVVEGLVPDKKFLQYTIFKVPQGYRVICSYRERPLFNCILRLYQGVDFFKKDDILHFSFRILCELAKTLGEQFTEEEISFIISNMYEGNNMQVLLYNFEYFPDTLKTDIKELLTAKEMVRSI